MRQEIPSPDITNQMSLGQGAELVRDISRSLGMEGTEVGDAN